MVSTRSRLTACALLLSALVLGSLPALGLASPLAETSTAEYETCRSCSGCETGECDESSPFEAGDHCCPSTCMEHSVWELAVPPTATSSQRCETTLAPELERALQKLPHEIYQPPRP